MKSNNLRIVRAIFDVDGVFTDGKFTYSSEGKIYKQFGAHDGDGIKLLKKAGLNILAISADKRGFQITKARMDDMKIPLTLVAEQERLDWILDSGNPDQTFFMGDGFYDAACMKRVAFSAAPQNAVEIAKKQASYVTKSPGGSGAVFEACIFLLADVLNLEVET
jgi:3-deoxy-D-manno-octulosonate 8-phosphate phosphatase (KDO 8-P phosphatase)